LSHYLVSWTYSPMRLFFLYISARVLRHAADAKARPADHFQLLNVPDVDDSG